MQCCWDPGSWLAGSREIHIVFYTNTKFPMYKYTKAKCKNAMLLGAGRLAGGIKRAQQCCTSRINQCIDIAVIIISLIIAVITVVFIVIIIIIVFVIIIITNCIRMIIDRSSSREGGLGA